MNQKQACNLVAEIFIQPGDATRLLRFTGNMRKPMGQSKAFVCDSQYLKNILVLPIKGMEGGAA